MGFLDWITLRSSKNYKYVKKSLIDINMSKYRNKESITIKMDSVDSAFNKIISGYPIRSA